MIISFNVHDMEYRKRNSRHSLGKTNSNGKWQGRFRVGSTRTSCTFSLCCYSNVLQGLLFCSNLTTECLEEVKGDFDHYPTCSRTQCRCHSTQTAGSNSNGNDTPQNDDNDTDYDGEEDIFN